jgi:hypothetical protein
MSEKRVEFTRATKLAAWRRCHGRCETGEEDIPAIAKSNRVLLREAGLFKSGSIRTWRSR